jgi:hypothetical protein
MMVPSPVTTTNSRRPLTDFFSYSPRVCRPPTFQRPSTNSHEIFSRNANSPTHMHLHTHQLRNLPPSPSPTRHTATVVESRATGAARQQLSAFNLHTPYLVNATKHDDELAIQAPPCVFDLTSSPLVVVSGINIRSPSARQHLSSQSFDSKQLQDTTQSEYSFRVLKITLPRHSMLYESTN